MHELPWRTSTQPIAGSLLSCFFMKWQLIYIISGLLELGKPIPSCRTIFMVGLMLKSIALDKNTHFRWHVLFQQPSFQKHFFKICAKINKFGFHLTKTLTTISFVSWAALYFRQMRYKQDRRNIKLIWFTYAFQYLCSLGQRVLLSTIPTFMLFLFKSNLKECTLVFHSLCFLLKILLGHTLRN